MTSIIISIEHKNSYELATELVLALQETKSVVNPVSVAQTNDYRTTLELLELQHDARERIMKEASSWANTKGLKSIPTASMQYSSYNAKESSYLTIR
jgi:hypothetical protein